MDWNSELIRDQILLMCFRNNASQQLKFSLIRLVLHRSLIRRRLKTINKRIQFSIIAKGALVAFPVIKVIPVGGDSECKSF